MVKPVSKHLRPSLPANEIFQHGTLASTLPTHYCDLRKIQLHMHSELGECILKFIYDGDKLFHPHVTRHREKLLAQLDPHNRRFSLRGGKLIWPTAHNAARSLLAIELQTVEDQ